MSAFLQQFPAARTLSRYWARACDHLGTRSRRLVHALVPRMEAIIVAWLAIFGAAAALRIAFAATPIRDAADFAEVFLPYALAALAPVAGYRIAMAAFPPGALPALASFHLAPFGRWRRLDLLAARAHPQFGPFGFMASLLVGMLINIPVRSFEFLLAVPAMNFNAPAWGTAIFYRMTRDLVVMNFLYAVCFVMALRSIPLFPRMLAFAWIMDVMLQLSIAKGVVAAGVPAMVAAPMANLLEGNITKVLISAAIWLPYLLLSDRVNVTYRSRVGA